MKGVILEITGSAGIVLCKDGRVRHVTLKPGSVVGGEYTAPAGPNRGLVSIAAALAVVIGLFFFAPEANFNDYIPPAVIQSGPGIVDPGDTISIVDEQVPLSESPDSEESFLEEHGSAILCAALAFASVALIALISALLRQ
ncbi:MAG: hypothetical protein LBN43_05755 [Oscillospiraceae bacterium]|nr:hypothetical protein [Oscillospiraceae bacterium]